MPAASVPDTVPDSFSEGKKKANLQVCVRFFRTCTSSEGCSGRLYSSFSAQAPRPCAGMKAQRVARAQLSITEVDPHTARATRPSTHPPLRGYYPSGRLAESSREVGAQAHACTRRAPQQRGRGRWALRAGGRAARSPARWQWHPARTRAPCARACGCGLCALGIRPPRATAARWGLEPYPSSPPPVRGARPPHGLPKFDFREMTTGAARPAVAAALLLWWPPRRWR